MTLPQNWTQSVVKTILRTQVSALRILEKPMKPDKQQQQQQQQTKTNKLQGNAIMEHEHLCKSSI